MRRGRGRHRQDDGPRRTGREPARERNGRRRRARGDHVHREGSRRARHARARRARGRADDGRGRGARLAARSRARPVSRAHRDHPQLRRRAAARAPRRGRRSTRSSTCSTSSPRRSSSTGPTSASRTSCFASRAQSSSGRSAAGSGWPSYAKRARLHEHRYLLPLRHPEPRPTMSRAVRPGDSADRRRAARDADKTPARRRQGRADRRGNPRLGGRPGRARSGRAGALAADRGPPRRRTGRRHERELGRREGATQAAPATTTTTRSSRPGRACAPTPCSACCRTSSVSSTDYAAERKRDGRADFDDLLFWARDLLRDSAPARRYFRRRFRAVLIDEFQDTDPVQAELALLLTSDEEPGEGLAHAAPGGRASDRRG